jgi:hypothetical protein
MRSKIIVMLAAASLFSAGCSGQPHEREGHAKPVAPAAQPSAMTEYLDVDFPHHPPSAYVNGTVIPAASIDWEAVNGIPAQTKPSALLWPKPQKLTGSTELKLAIPAIPLSVYVRPFDSIGKNGFPTRALEPWECSRLKKPGCGFRLEGRSHVMILPESVFMNGGTWYTIQVFWDVPYPERHPGYLDRASATMVWLFTRES